MNVFLRLATISDCSFIFQTRVNPELGEFLGGPPKSLEDQIAWFHRYSERNARREEFYFVICDAESASPCGLLRVYDIRNEHCTWGSWVLVKARPQGSAIASAFLSFRFIFEELKLSHVKLRVHRENVRAQRLYHLFGFEVTSSLEQEDEMTLHADKFSSERGRWLELLSGQF